MSKSNNQPFGYEVVRSSYFLSEDGNSDILFAKINRWNTETDVEPMVAVIKNFKRDFYVTKPHLRKHKDQRDYEAIENLDKYTCHQHELADKIALALGKRRGTDYRLLADSPYLYGADLSPSVVFKSNMEKKYPQCKSPKRTIATLDIEASPDKERRVRMVTVFYNDVSYLWVDIQWIGNGQYVIDRISEEWHNRIMPMLKRPTELKLFLVDGPSQCVIESIKKLHELNPDIVSIWNMDYDIPTMVAQLKRDGYLPKDIFSHPSVPAEYRHYSYEQGKGTKEKAGKTTTIHPADRWHKPKFPAGWYPIDSMAVYKTIRIASGMEPNYTLDGALERNLGIHKLTLPGTEHLTGDKWHLYMQTHEKFVYCAYGAFDGIALAYLEEKTKDLSTTFPILCDISDYEIFKSNPSKIIDNMHIYAESQGYIMGTRPRVIVDELDKYVIGLNGWIAVLPASLMENNGLKVFEDLPNQETRLYIGCGDIDISTTYPAIEQEMGIAKCTTYSELVSIEGFSEAKRREFGVNALAGAVNAIETCCKGFDLPTPDDWVKMYTEEFS